MPDDAPYLDIPTMRPRNPLNDREAEPASACLAAGGARACRRMGAGLVYAVEAIKEAREMLGGDTRPIIFHTDPDASFLFPLPVAGFDMNVPANATCIADPILNQIGQHLTEIERIALDSKGS